MKLEGAVAVITGGASGIGEAVVERAAGSPEWKVDAGG